MAVILLSDWQDDSFEAERWYTNTDSLDALKFNLEGIKRVLDHTTQSATILLDVICPAEKRDKSLITLPQSLFKAWTHLLMLMIYLKLDSSEDLWRLHMRRFCSIVDAGTKKLAYSLPRAKLLEQTVVLPAEIGLIASLQALKDVTNGLPDLTGVYSRYIKQLVREPSGSALYSVNAD